MEIDEIHTHPLTSENICEPTIEKLTDKGTNRGSNLDTEVLVCVELLSVAVNVAQHCRGNVDGKDIVAVMSC